MSEAPTNPHESRPRTDREYEDPHYHDEEPDVQAPQEFLMKGEDSVRP